ncbi:helix-turn-helix domain-containing protein [Sunxiuqinia sp. sy24]|uniref:helix-turn-helix domain-containing protein n=1 Tax=Sunxiuqinia sp. sy24 TaxID=3461495 RepID=UPI0040460AD3
MKLHIRNMVSNRCKMIVKSELKKLRLHYILVELGEVEIMESLAPEELEQLNSGLQESGLAIIEDRKGILIERIKNIIIELVHYSEEQIKVNLSDYLSEKLNYDYTYLSNLFKENQGITIEHFLLSHKVERVKELLVYDELNVTEIAYIMHYSSVAHLSNQFKKLTGLTPSHYKQLKIKRNPLENM